MKLLWLPILALLLQEGEARRCYNDGVRGKRGEHHSCQCLMACVDPGNNHGYGDGAATKCKTYCRRTDCHCKMPCD